MSLIEKAVERLEKLKQAGVEVPATGVDAGMARSGCSAELAPQVPASSPAAESVDTAQRALEAVSTEAEKVPAPPRVSPIPVHPDATQCDLTVDLPRLAAMGMVTPDLPRSHVAEEFRIVKRPLLINAQGGGAAAIENGNLIMVTSALPGEGKSFTTINLAISMAMELDFTVLLVDADVSKPSVLELLGGAPARGLMDVLNGTEDDLSNVLLRTNINKFSILPAGMPQPNATELLASDAMNRLLDEIASRYSDRIIVFDSPPLLVTTEARALATHMGQVVMVVEANHTSQNAVRQALATIESCPVKLMLLNKSTEGGPGAYGYGYGYGYGNRQKGEESNGGPKADAA